MVRLISLQAYNFKKLKFDEPLRFPEGIVLVSGLNESGKSSILDAVLYALYARVIKPPPERGKTKNEDIIGYGASEATVTLEFAIQDRKFKVTRRVHRRRPTRANLDEILEGGKLRPIGTTQEKVTQEIEKLLGGITYGEIVSSNVVAQKELNRLIQLRTDDRRKIVNVFLNLESFNTVIEALDEERKNLEGTQARTGKIPLEEQKLDAIKLELDEFRNRQDEANRLDLEIKTQNAEATTVQAEFDSVSRLHKLLSDYAEAQQTRQNLNEQLDGRKRLLDSHMKQIEHINNDIQKTNTDLQRFTHLADAEQILTNMESKLRQLDGLEIKLDQEELRRDNTVSEIADLESKLPSQEELGKLRELKEAKGPIWPIALGSGVSFVSSFLAFMAGSSLVAAIMGLIGTALLVVLGLRISKVTQLAKAKELWGQLQYLDAKRSEMRSIENSLAAIKREISMTESEVEHLYSNLPRYKNTVASMAGLQVRETARSILRAYGTDLDTRDRLIASLQTLKQQLDALPTKQDLHALEAEVRELERKVSQIPLPELPPEIKFSKELLQERGAAKEKLGKKLTEINTKIQESRKRLAQLSEYLEQHKDVEQRFNEQGEVLKKLELELRIVKRAIEGTQKTAETLRNRVKDIVQSYMSRILPHLTAGRYKAARLDEDYNVQVWDPDAGEYRAKEVFSGGTEDQFLLAMRLSFALALLPEVKGLKPEFLFLDEPLASSDEIRRSGIIEYLNADLRHRFKQIFLISHVGGLETEVPNAILLEDGRPRSLQMISHAVTG